MSLIDMRSAMFIAGFIGGLMSVVLFFLRRSYPPTVRGIGDWALALATLFVANLLFAGRGLIPDLFSILLANVLVMVGVSMFYFGSQRFYGEAASVKLWLILGLLATPLLAWYTLVSPDYRLRLAVMTLFMGGSLAVHTRLILRAGGNKFPARFTAIVMAIETLIIFTRLASLLVDDPGTGLYGITSIQTMYVTSFAISTMLQALGVALMASDRVREELEHLASHDGLTGCLNRRALLEVCAKELDRSRRNGRCMSLLLLDIDHFKAINDNCGHHIGDQVIVKFVAHASGVLRRADSLGRYGGEEFVALLPETATEQALLVAERIRSAVDNGADVPPFTVSIGLASSDVQVSIDGLLARADAAMYQAKQAGRNRVVAAEPFLP